MKQNIAIVYGGYSSEAVVSEKSLAGLMGFINPETYTLYPVRVTAESWDVVWEAQLYPIDKNLFQATLPTGQVTFHCAYITIHGAPGENGQLQGYLEMMGIPYTTSGLLASAITFNKFTCNTYLKGFGVAVADSVLVRKHTDFKSSHIANTLGLPCFVKPNAGGSSFGVSKVKTVDELAPAIEKALEESDEVIIEQFLSGTEVTCGLYKTAQKTVLFPLTEVISKNEFFDYEAKYTPHMAEEITPARIPDRVKDKIQSIASAIYDILHLKGIVRIDFIIGADKIFLLEVNTTPGMTVTSFIPQQIRAANLPIQEVFDEVIQDAIARHVR